MEDVDRLAARLIAAMNPYDVASLQCIFADDITLSYPGLRPMVGKRMSLSLLKRIFSEFDYLRFTQTDLLVQSSKAAVVWVNEGLRKDGSRYDNEGVTILSVVGCKIVSLSDYFKLEIPSSGTRMTARGLNSGHHVRGEARLRL